MNTKSRIPIKDGLQKISNLMESHPYLSAFFIFSFLSLLINRTLIIESILYIGEGYFRFTTLPFTLKESLHYLPLILLDWASLPGAYAVGLLNCFYHFVGSFLMFIFLRTYLNDLFDSKKLFIPSLIGSLLFMFYPWNIVADRDPTLVMIKSLFSLVILSAYKGVNHDSNLTLVFSVVVISICTLVDPRSIIFFIPIIFFLTLLPHLIILKETKRNKHYFIRFIMLSILSFIFSFEELIFRLTNSFSFEESFPTVTMSNYNLLSFIPDFKYSDIIKTLQGICYRSVGRDFSIMYTMPYKEVFFILPLLSVIIMISVFLKNTTKNDKSRKYIFSLIIMFIGTTLVFSKIWGSQPLFIQLVKIARYTTMPLVKEVILLFRTERFLNLVYVTFLSLMGGISLKMYQSESKKFYRIIYILGIFLMFFTAFLWSFPLIKSGRGLVMPLGISFETNKESRDFSKLVSEIEPYSPIEKSLEIEQEIGGLPNLYFMHGVEAGVKVYLARYILNIGSFTSPILLDNDYDFLSHILEKMGVKYLMLNGYKFEDKVSSQLNNELNQSLNFKFRSKSHKVYAYENKGKIEPQISRGLYILGGLEDYRSIYKFFKRKNLDISPILLDIEIDPHKLKKYDFPILISNHKSKTDLIANFIVAERNATILKPAVWGVEYWDISKRWSPGYITDTTGGRWTIINMGIRNYEWSYSYRPTYGYIYTMDTKDTISRDVKLKQGRYKVLIRILMNPGGGTLRIKSKGNFAKNINTKWDYESSEFIWKNIGTFNFTEERSEFSIENLGGINSINLIMFVKKEDWEEKKYEAETFLNNRKILYIMDPEKEKIHYTRTTDFSRTKKPKGEMNFLHPIDANGYKFISFNRIQNISSKDNLIILNNKSKEHSTYTQDYKIQSRDLNQLFDNSEINEIEVQFPESIEIFFSKFDKVNNWIPSNPNFSVNRSSENYKCNSSIVVSTSTNEPGSWSWIKSPEIEVKPRHVYRFETTMKYENIVQTHVVIQGVKNNGTTSRLVVISIPVTGKLGWGTYSADIRIPPDVDKVRFALNSGWAHEKGKLGRTWFGHLSVISNLDLEKLPILISPDNLSELYSGPLPEIISKKTQVYDNSNKEYTIELKGSGEGIITTPVLYDNRWKVSNNKICVDDFPIYYILNGFAIKLFDNQTYKFTIYNPKQRLNTKLTYLYFAGVALLLLGTKLIMFYQKKNNHEKNKRGNQ